MTIEELKEQVLQFINNSITEVTKNDLIVWLKDNIDSQLTPISDAFVDKLKEQANEESGWCKFRDKYFIPTLINGVLFITSKLLVKMIDASNAFKSKGKT